jgi:hypothetical protein
MGQKRRWPRQRSAAGSLVSIWGPLSCFASLSLPSPLVEQGASSAPSALRSDHQDLSRSAPNCVPSGWLRLADPRIPVAQSPCQTLIWHPRVGVPLEQRTCSEKIRGVVVQAKADRERRGKDSHGASLQLAVLLRWLSTLPARKLERSLANARESLAEHLLACKWSAGRRQCLGAC